MGGTLTCVTTGNIGTTAVILNKVTFNTFSSGMFIQRITSLLGGSGAVVAPLAQKIVFDFDILDSRQTKQMKSLRLRISGR